MKNCNGQARVNRHTGGLEICAISSAVNLAVNRHTGGLEMYSRLLKTLLVVNRHTGGLENQRKPINR